MAAPRKRKCRECGEVFEARKSDAHFCSASCRKTFNNRRMTRGALLYDLFMAMRYDREPAKKNGVNWNTLCRLGELYHYEDQRDGRGRTHRPAFEVMQEHSTEINARRVG